MVCKAPKSAATCTVFPSPGQKAKELPQQKMAGSFTSQRTHFITQNASHAPSVQRPEPLHASNLVRQQRAVDAPREHEAMWKCYCTRDS